MISVPAKCCCLKYRTPWQCLLLRVWPQSSFGYRTVNESVNGVLSMKLKRHQNWQLWNSCTHLHLFFIFSFTVAAEQNIYFKWNHCSFLLIYPGSSLHFLLLSFQNSSLFIMCHESYVPSPSCIHSNTCTHPPALPLPLPLLTSPRFLSIYPVLPKASPLALA